MRTEVLFVHLPNATKERMRVVCRRTGQNLSSLTRKALREHLKKYIAEDGRSFEWQPEE